VTSFVDPTHEISLQLMLAMVLLDWRCAGGLQKSSLNFKIMELDGLCINAGLLITITHVLLIGKTIIGPEQESHFF
jgi:hypothetical protein